LAPWQWQLFSWLSKRLSAARAQSLCGRPSQDGLDAARGRRFGRRRGVCRKRRRRRRRRRARRRPRRRRAGVRVAPGRAAAHRGDARNARGRGTHAPKPRGGRANVSNLSFEKTLETLEVFLN
ncbi:hypothetical protein M885DRAFT_612324, partial [Pelagophyceae sp. CCMP2097]